MQDEAPCHRLRLVQKWLWDECVHVFDWPSYSPDMNHIENLWGILARHLYEYGRQVGEIHSLIESIEEV